MSSYYTCSFSSPADKAYGAACWAALVESCHKTLDWTIEPDEQDIETSLSDAIVITITTTSTTAAPTIDTTTKEIDFLNAPYVSFDWTLEDEEASSTCPSLVSAVVPPWTSKSTTTPLGPKFALGRFMETISEVEEEEMMMVGTEDDVDSEDSTELATPPPSVGYDDRDERYRHLQNPTYQEIDELFDIPSDRRVSTMKNLGIYAGYLRRAVVVKLPDPNAKLSRSYHGRDSLSILAWAASTQRYAPFSNLDLLASCC
jgi:hypothetical protein